MLFNFVTCKSFPAPIYNIFESSSNYNIAIVQNAYTIPAAIESIWGKSASVMFFSTVVASQCIGTASEQFSFFVLVRSLDLTGSRVSFSRNTELLMRLESNKNHSETSGFIPIQYLTGTSSKLNAFISCLLAPT